MSQHSPCLSSSLSLPPSPPRKRGKKPRAVAKVCLCADFLFGEVGDGVSGEWGEGEGEGVEGWLFCTERIQKNCMNTDLGILCVCSACDSHVDMCFIFAFIHM